MGFTDDVKGKAEDLGGKAGDAFDTAKDKAGDAFDTARDKASEVLDAARDKAETAWDAVTDKAEEVFEVVKDKADDVATGVTQRFESGADPSSDETPLVEDFAAVGTVPEDASVQDAAPKPNERPDPL